MSTYIFSPTKFRDPRLDSEPRVWYLQCFSTTIDCIYWAPDNSRVPISFLESHPSPAPGRRLPLTANIFPVTPAANPSTCRAYCSTCLLFNKVSSLPGSCGSLNNLCHSSSGSGVCFANALLAFSDFRFACHAVILACSRAS